MERSPTVDDRRVLVVYRGVEDRAALDRAIDAAAEFDRRLVLVVPVLGLSPLSHSSQLALEETCLELDAEAGEKASEALRHIPDSIEVSTRLVRPGSESSVLAAADPVALMVCAEEPALRLRLSGLFLRSCRGWFREARRAGIPVIEVTPVAAS